MNLPFARRREALASSLALPKDPVRLSPLLHAPSGDVLEAVRKLGLEGVVGKRLGSAYEPGERSGAWIKTDLLQFRGRFDSFYSVGVR